ncbi:hypothetical protein BLOT_008626 [Blomia tropicalis]|nr:hypothetical protein BLOT_008626 [Blomia tropicalis]
MVGNTFKSIFVVGHELMPEMEKYDFRLKQDTRGNLMNGGTNRLDEFRSEANSLNRGGSHVSTRSNQ